MNWVRKLFISLGIASLVVCFGAVLLFNWSITGWRALSVPTGSMRPTIPPGSLVLMHNVPNSSLKVGDVITYTSAQNRKLITHRIVKAYKINDKIPAYITKGDANPNPDLPIVGGQVKGRSVWHVPYIGTWLTWGKGWPSLIVMVYIPALIIMIEQIGLLAEYYKKVKLYSVPGYESSHHSNWIGKAATGVMVTLAVVTAGLIIAPSIHALLASNTVSLAPNQLSVVASKPPDNHCTNNNSVNINSNSNQTATTGSATSSNNTTNGSATSGNASNSNSTSVNINVNNNCQ